VSINSVTLIGSIAVILCTAEDGRLNKMSSLIVETDAPVSISAKYL
jgi:hypothetical protein